MVGAVSSCTSSCSSVPCIYGWQLAFLAHSYTHSCDFVIEHFLRGVTHVQAMNKGHELKDTITNGQTASRFFFDDCLLSIRSCDSFHSLMGDHFAKWGAGENSPLISGHSSLRNPSPRGSSRFAWEWRGRNGQRTVSRFPLGNVPRFQTVLSKGRVVIHFRGSSYRVGNLF